VKPFEEEAETTILRAIEKQDKEREKFKEEDGYKQGILEGVPAEAIHLFGDVINDDKHDGSNQRTIPNALSKRDMIRPMVSFFSSFIIFCVVVKLSTYSYTNSFHTYIVFIHQTTCFKGYCS
jgi:hypothetical protein